MGQSAGDGVSTTQVYNSTNGALYGALNVATLPAGGTVAYTYAATSIGYGGRSLALTVPSGGTQPRVLFSDDTVLVTWLDAAAIVHLQSYIYAGRWLMTGIATAQLAAAADYAGVQIALGDGCAAMFAAGKVLAVARDVTNPGAWLLPAQSYTPALASNEPATLVAGRGFVALLGLTGGVLYRYRFAAAAWTADAALTIGTSGNSFALAAKDAVLAALAAPAEGGATSIALLMRGTDGAWNETKAAVDLGGLAGTLILDLGSGFGVVRATAADVLALRAQYGAFWWPADLGTVSGQEWLTLRLATNATALTPVIAGSAVAIGRRLYRYDGVAWTSFDASSVTYPGASAPVTAMLGSDAFAQLFAGTTAGQQVAALMVYDPNTSKWSTPANLAIAADAPLAALPARTAGPAAPYALIGNQLWYCSPTGSWASVLTLPSGLNAGDLASAQLMGDDYLVVQKGTGTAGVATLVYLLGNGGVLNAAAPITLSGSQVAVSGQPASILVGERAFVAYTGAWGSAAVLTLFRPVSGNVQGKQIGYGAALVTVENGTQGIPDINGSFKTQYLPDSASAVIGAEGYYPLYNKVVVVPGGVTGGSQVNGNMTYGIYNGLAASEQPAVPYPGAPASQTAMSVLAGELYSQQANDSTAAAVASSLFFWSPTTKTLGQWGQGAYARTVQASAIQSGVTQTSTTQYASETGLPTQVSVGVNNVAGTVDTFTTLLTYWWQIYDKSRSLNLLTPVIQTEQRSTPAGVSAATIAIAIETWRSDWGNGAGRWAPDRSFVALNASPPAFNSWNPSDAPPASGYQMTGRVLQRTAAGLPLKSISTDPFNTPAMTVYDTSGSYPVFAAGNVAPGADMISWFGCEPYETSGGWASSNPSLSIWDYVTSADSHTGTQCLALPANTAASGPILGLQPADQTRRYLFSCWARAANGFVPASGLAQWTIQPYDPATGKNAGSAILLVLTPTQTGVPTAVGGWCYFQATIDLPALVKSAGKPALGLSIAATNANTAKLCYIDELRFTPLDCVFSVNVYDPRRWWLTATIGTDGQSRQLRYDAGGEPYLGLGPNDRVDWLGAASYSRAITKKDEFSASIPNTALLLQTSADSRYYDFRDGNVADWAFAGGNWSITGGQLVHTGAGAGAVGATATLTVCAYTYLGACIEVASPQPTGTATISLGNGDVYMQWSQTDAAGTLQFQWQLVQVTNNVAKVLQINTQVPWGRRWTFSAVDGFVLCFVDAVQVFADQYDMPLKIPKDYGKVWVATTVGAAFDNLIVLNTPQIGLSFADGVGTSLQTMRMQGYAPADGPLYPKQMIASATGVLLDQLGRPAVQRLDMVVPVQFAALTAPDNCKLIAASPSTYLYSPTGSQLSLPKYLAGDDGGYTYEQTTYATSPLSQPTQLVLPRPNDPANPAANYTIAMAYGGSQTVGGPPATGTNKYLIASASRVLSTSAAGVTQTVTEIVTRDGLGRVLMEKQGLSSTALLRRAYLYDNASRLATVRLPNYFFPPSGTNATAWVETYSYDFLGRLIQRTAPDFGHHASHVRLSVPHPLRSRRRRRSDGRSYSAETVAHPLHQIRCTRSRDRERICSGCDYQVGRGVAAEGRRRAVSCHRRRSKSAERGDGRMAQALHLRFRRIGRYALSGRPPVEGGSQSERQRKQSG